jgi:uncharacterized membrane protein YdjX (TVP38/TMEM64 family)
VSNRNKTARGLNKFFLTHFFLSVYMFATVLFIPGSILTLGSGFVFSMAFGLGAGVVLGTISVFIGACFGAISAFVLGRYLLKDQVSKLSRKYAIFQALNLALEANGLKIFLLLRCVIMKLQVLFSIAFCFSSFLRFIRLSPIIPFTVLNYIAGALSVSFRDYVLALIAILPGTVLYVFLGASAGSLTDSMNSGQDPTVTIVVVVVGIVFGILAICLTTRYARKELNRLLDERRSTESGAGEETMSSLEVGAQIRTSMSESPINEDDLEATVVHEC